MTITRFSRVKAVAFDVYGTLVHITDARRPYRKLLSHAAESGRFPLSSDGARLMSTDVGLSAAAKLLGITLPSKVLGDLEEDLAIELASIRLFEDALPAVNSLKQRGFRVGVCSNLASPYAAPVLALLPQLDAYAWSFTVGAVKPQSSMYAHLCSALGAAPEEVLMVGDTFAADYAGAILNRMQGCHLARNGISDAARWISTLAELEQLISSS